MMTTTTNRCSKRVYKSGEYGMNQCARNGVAEEEGKWWCRQHLPLAVKARREKHEAILSAEGSRRIAAYRRARDLEVLGQRALAVVSYIADYVSQIDTVSMEEIHTIAIAYRKLKEEETDA